MELEARGAKVVPVFAGGLDFSSPVKKFFYDPLGSGKAFVDCCVSLTGGWWSASQGRGRAWAGTTWGVELGLGCVAASPSAGPTVS
jgi:hypothetical protein